MVIHYSIELKLLRSIVHTLRVSLTQSLGLLYQRLPNGEKRIDKNRKKKSAKCSKLPIAGPVCTGQDINYIKARKWDMKKKEIYRKSHN